jgi:hypothetical protein
MESPCQNKYDKNNNLLTPCFLYQSNPLNEFYSHKNICDYNDNFIKQTKFIGNNSELISITNHNEIYLNKIKIPEDNHINKINNIDIDRDIDTEENEINQNYDFSSDLIFKENNAIYDIDM